MAKHRNTAFERTVRKSNEWLEEVALLFGGSSQREAYSALRVGLHALRDRLTTEEMADLGAQLPMLLRGLFYEGWHPGSNPRKIRHLSDFFELVKEDLPNNFAYDPEFVVWAVFRTLSNRVPPGELGHISQILPRELQIFWDSATIDEVRERTRTLRERTGWSR